MFKKLLLVLGFSVVCLGASPIQYVTKQVFTTEISRLDGRIDAVVISNYGGFISATNAVQSNAYAYTDNATNEVVAWVLDQGYGTSTDALSAEWARVSLTSEVFISFDNYTNSAEVTIGQGANASLYGVAAGYQATATNRGVAAGQYANGSEGGVAVGRSTLATNYGVAVGYQSKAVSGAAVIGTNMQNTVPGTLMIPPDTPTLPNHAVPKSHLDAAIDTVSNGFVLKSGDTMTGNLAAPEYRGNTGYLDVAVIGEAVITNMVVSNVTVNGTLYYGDTPLEQRFVDVNGDEMHGSLILTTNDPSSQFVKMIEEENLIDPSTVFAGGNFGFNPGFGAMYLGNTTYPLSGSANGQPAFSPFFQYRIYFHSDNYWYLSVISQPNMPNGWRAVDSGVFGITGTWAAAANTLPGQFGIPTSMTLYPTDKTITTNTSGRLQIDTRVVNPHYYALESWVSGLFLPLTGGSMTGPLYLMPPSTDDEAARKVDVDAKLDRGGDSMYGDLDMGGNSITNVKDLHVGSNTIYYGEVPIEQRWKSDISNLETNLARTTSGNEGFRRIGGLGGYTLEEFMEDTGTRGPTADKPTFLYTLTNVPPNLTVRWTQGDVYSPLLGYFHINAGTNNSLQNFAVNYAYWSIAASNTISWTTGSRPVDNISNIYLATFYAGFGLITAGSIAPSLGDLPSQMYNAQSEVAPSMVVDGILFAAAGTNLNQVIMSPGVEYQDGVTRVEHPARNLANPLVTPYILGISHTSTTVYSFLLTNEVPIGLYDSGSSLITAVSGNWYRAMFSSIAVSPYITYTFPTVSYTSYVDAVNGVDPAQPSGFDPYVVQSTAYIYQGGDTELRTDSIYWLDRRFMIRRGASGSGGGPSGGGSTPSLYQVLLAGNNAGGEIIENSGTPTEPLQVANKAYVDSRVDLRSSGRAYVDRVGDDLVAEVDSAIHPFKTIQAAINAAAAVANETSRYIVTLSPGIYDESIGMSNYVGILGSDVEATSINGTVTYPPAFTDEGGAELQYITITAVNSPALIVNSGAELAYAGARSCTFISQYYTDGVNRTTCLLKRGWLEVYGTSYLELDLWNTDDETVMGHSSIYRVETDGVNTGSVNFTCHDNRHWVDCYDTNDNVSLMHSSAVDGLLRLKNSVCTLNFSASNCLNRVSLLELENSGSQVQLNNSDVDIVLPLPNSVDVLLGYASNSISPGVVIANHNYVGKYGLGLGNSYLGAACETTDKLYLFNNTILTSPGTFPQRYDTDGALGTIDHISQHKGGDLLIGGYAYSFAGDPTISNQLVIKSWVESFVDNHRQFLDHLSATNSSDSYVTMAAEEYNSYVEFFNTQPTLQKFRVGLFNGVPGAQDDINNLVPFSVASPIGNDSCVPLGYATTNYYSLYGGDVLGNVIASNITAYQTIAAPTITATAVIASNITAFQQVSAVSGGVVSVYNTYEPGSGLIGINCARLTRQSIAFDSYSNPCVITNDESQNQVLFGVGIATTNDALLKRLVIRAPSQSYHAATKGYVDSIPSAYSDTFVKKTGDTMSGGLLFSTNVAIPLLVPVDGQNIIVAGDLRDVTYGEWATGKYVVAGVDSGYTWYTNRNANGYIFMLAWYTSGSGWFIEPYVSGPPIGFSGAYNVSGANPVGSYVTVFSTTMLGSGVATYEKVFSSNYLMRTSGQDTMQGDLNMGIGNSVIISNAVANTGVVRVSGNAGASVEMAIGTTIPVLNFRDSASLGQLKYTVAGFSIGDINGTILSGVAWPTNNNHAVSKIYADTKFVQKAGDTMAGDITMGSGGNYYNINVADSVGVRIPGAGALEVTTVANVSSNLVVTNAYAGGGYAQVLAATPTSPNALATKEYVDNTAGESKWCNIWFTNLSRAYSAPTFTNIETFVNAVGSNGFSYTTNSIQAHVAGTMFVSATISFVNDNDTDVMYLGISTNNIVLPQTITKMTLWNSSQVSITCQGMVNNVASGTTFQVKITTTDLPAPGVSDGTFIINKL